MLLSNQSVGVTPIVSYTVIDHYHIVILQRYPSLAIFFTGDIVDSMAWFHTNLYQFDIQNGNQIDYVGLRFEPSFYYGEENVKCAMCFNITDVFKKRLDKVIHSYDFRREWKHEVLLQRIIPKTIGLSQRVLMN